MTVRLIVPVISLKFAETYRSFANSSRRLKRIIHEDNSSSTTSRLLTTYSRAVIDDLQLMMEEQFLSKYSGGTQNRFTFVKKHGLKMGCFIYDRRFHFEFYFISVRLL